MLYRQSMMNESGQVLINSNTKHLYWAESFNKAWLDPKARDTFLIKKEKKKQVWNNNGQMCI